MDIQGIEPWTSRMRSVRATTVPNALVFYHQTMYYKVAKGHQVVGDTAEAILDLAPVSFQLAGRLRRQMGSLHRGSSQARQNLYHYGAL